MKKPKKQPKQRMKVVVFHHGEGTGLEFGEGEFMLHTSGCLDIYDADGNLSTTFSPTGWEQVRLVPVEPEA
jgi:hypothetical protein